MAVGFWGWESTPFGYSKATTSLVFFSYSAHINPWFLVLRGLVCALYRGRGSMRNATHDGFSWLQHLGHL